MISTGWKIFLNADKKIFDILLTSLSGFGYYGGTWRDFYKGR